MKNKKRLIFLFLAINIAICASFMILKKEEKTYSGSFVRVFDGSDKL